VLDLTETRHLLFESYSGDCLGKTLLSVLMQLHEFLDCTIESVLNGMHPSLGLAQHVG